MRAYNPLSVDELGRNAVRTLMEYPSCDLPPAESFEGGGIYTIHYRGSFPAYANMGDETPIYVGKADLPGKRQGRAWAAHLQDGRDTAADILAAIAEHRSKEAAP